MSADSSAQQLHGGCKAHLLGSTNHAWVSRKAGHVCVCLGSDMPDTLRSGGF